MRVGQFEELLAKDALENTRLLQKLHTGRLLMCRHTLLCRKDKEHCMLAGDYYVRPLTVC